MVSNRKKKLQKKKLFNQVNRLSEGYTDFMIGKSNHDVRNESRDSMAYRGTSSDNTNNATQVNYPHVDKHTHEENIVSKVRSEVDYVITSVETRVQDMVLTAIDNLVIPIVELAMKSTNASSGWTVDGNVLKPDHRDFSGNVEGL